MFKEDDSLIRDFKDGTDLLEKVKSAYISGEIMQIYFYQVNKIYVLEYDIKVEVCKNGDKFSFVQGKLKRNDESNRDLFSFTIDFIGRDFPDFTITVNGNIITFRPLYNSEVSSRKRRNKYIDCIDYIQQFTYNFISGKQTILGIDLYQDNNYFLGGDFFCRSDDEIIDCDDNEFSVKYYHFKNGCDNALKLLNIDNVKLRIEYTTYTLANMLAIGDSCFTTVTRVIDSSDADFNFYFKKLFGQKWVCVYSDWIGDDYDD